MDRKQRISIAAISAAIMVFAISAVAASFQTVHTPLYKVRMEQQSSEMNFLPTERNDFTYSTENGCTLTYDIPAYCGDVKPLDTCANTQCCYYTHNLTCPRTCYNTCKPTACAPCPFK